MDRELTFIDLFCGAGGMSLGFVRAGWKSIIAIDHFPAAVDTHRINLGEDVSCREISEDIDLPIATLIVGGPPCQGFSSAGMRRPGDERNTLVTVFSQVIARQKPTAFVFENVEGFLTADNGHRVLDLLCPLVEVGYRIHLRKINASNYGVPQHRKRVIAIGGLGWEPTFPSPLFSAYGAPGAPRPASSLPLAPSLADALADLPAPSLSLPGEPQGHFVQSVPESEIERIQMLKPGQTMRDLPKELWHESFHRRAFRRVMDGTPTERRGGAPAGVRRLRPDHPSKAITSFARREFVHPTQDRFLTLRGCARIQTFPDDFEFIGTQADQALLIGNAVPPILAEVIARSLAKDLKNAKAVECDGTLLSFFPTMSEGMSPALESITKRVFDTFGQHTNERKQLPLWD
jgi:DNA (cytosine-5)-methyltransferase 1